MPKTIEEYKELLAKHYKPLTIENSPELRALSNALFELGNVKRNFSDYKGLLPFELRLYQIGEQYYVEKNNDDDDDGFFRTLFVIAKVAALATVTILAPGSLAAVMPMLEAGSIANAIGTGILVGATDFGLQGAGTVMGIQDRISTNEILETAVGAGVATGTVGLPTLPHVAATTSATVATELAEIQTGLRDTFEIKEVALAAATTIVADGLRRIMPNTTDKLDQQSGTVVNTITNSAVSSVVESIITGKPVNLTNVAANIVGNIAGKKASELIDVSKQTNMVSREAPKQENTVEAKYDPSKICLINDNSYVGQLKNQLNKMTPIDQSINYKAVDLLMAGKFDDIKNLPHEQTYTPFENISNTNHVYDTNKTTINDAVTTQDERNAAKILEMLAKSSPTGEINTKIFDNTQKTLEILVDLAEQLPGKSIGKTLVNSSLSFFAESRKHLRSFIFGTPQEHQQAIHDLAIDAAILLPFGRTEIVGEALDFTILGKSSGFNVPKAELSAVKKVGDIKFFKPATSSVAANPTDQLLQALKESKIPQALEQIEANSPNAANALSKKMSRLADAQQEADKVEVLSDGTIKYYDKFRPAKEKGSTIGARFVTTYNPASGEVTTLNEAYDASMNVNRVSLKSINGVRIKSPHFPPTLKEVLQETLETNLSPANMGRR